MNKYKCNNNECLVSMFALANPMQCGRCGQLGMKQVEEGPTDLPSALYMTREGLIMQDVVKGIQDIETYLGEQ